MKIALAQINYHIGHFDANVLKIKNAIQEAKQKDVDLIVFAEMAVSGYPPRDFLEFDDFIQKCYQAIKEIAQSCHGIAAIVGSPSINPSAKGKSLYNSAYFLYDGDIQDITHKSLLPTYDIFDEYRYFEPFRDVKILNYMGCKIALTICEDIWDIGDERLYTVSPMDVLAKQGPDLMINIAASPFHYRQASSRREVLVRNALRYNLPLFYVNHVGAQTELLFDGGSMVINRDGEILDEFNYFEEDFRVYDLKEGSNEVSLFYSDVKSAKQKPESKISLIHDALVMGIRNYFQKLGFSKAILGLSGGIDSAVTLALAVRALGNDNVKAVLLPSRYSSEHSVNDAVILARNLNVPYDIIHIEKAFKSFEETMSQWFGGLPADITEENLQARIRAVILMSLSNKFGYILLNTSNKSEAAVGYGTLYGDMCGGLSVLGDVYKTEVFDLARYINRSQPIIPEHTLSKPPSAELRPGQKDSDSLPDYEILDQILYQYIELRKGPGELIDLGYSKETVSKILKLVNTNEHKRYQMPPVLRVSTKAFGMGRRMPIVAKYLS